MALRTFYSFLARKRQRKKEAPDIWKLYHFLYFYKQAMNEPAIYGGGIKEPEKINFALPDRTVSAQNQHETVHKAVTEQVCDHTNPPH